MRLSLYKRLSWCLLCRAERGVCAGQCRSLMTLSGQKGRQICHSGWCLLCWGGPCVLHVL
jgi:hypothetical protein